MARLLTESFELDAGTGPFLRVVNGTTPSQILTTTPIDATRYVSAGGAGSFSYTFASLTELYCGFFFRVDSFSTVGRVVAWLSGATVQGSLHINTTTRALEARTGASTVVGTGPVLTLNTIYHIQFRVLIDNAVGVIQVRLDNNSVISFTGDTQPGAPTDITNLVWGTNGGSPGGENHYDTIVINDTTGGADNSWPDVVRVLRLGPTGPGTYVNNWSRNTGSTNWEQVDEVPNDGDTTYLFTTTANLYESFSMGDFSVANANIRAIITSAIAKKDSGTVQLAVGIRDDDNSTDYFGANAALPTTYGIIQERRTTDPSTGTSWTVAGARATQGLIVSTTG